MAAKEGKNKNGEFNKVGCEVEQTVASICLLYALTCSYKLRGSLNDVSFKHFRFGRKNIPVNFMCPASSSKMLKDKNRCCHSTLLDTLLRVTSDALKCKILLDFFLMGSFGKHFNEERFA